MERMTLKNDGRGFSNDLVVKCLVVDDRPANLLSMSALLAEDGVQVLIAASGREALELALVHDLALALLDVQMPEMDGFELAELLRGSERTRQVPIIFVTAGASDQQRMFKGYEAGAVDFLFKPIESRVLKSKTAVFFDLYRTRRRLALELADRTETLKLNETFSAILGHDLRSPLSAIQLAAALIERRATDADVRDKAGLIADSSRRMGRMIGDLLDLSRARLAGGIPVAPAEVSAQALTMRVVAEHAGAQPAMPIETHFSGDMHARWDADRVVQLMSNLVANALAHGEPGQPVTVSVDGDSKNELVICVRNHGAIPADARLALFEPFRARTAGDAKRQGLGLGLFIVQQIAQAHGGTVSLDPDKGDVTCFRVALPRVAQ